MERRDSVTTRRLVVGCEPSCLVGLTMVDSFVGGLTAPSLFQTAPGVRGNGHVRGKGQEGGGRPGPMGMPASPRGEAVEGGRARAGGPAMFSVPSGGSRRWLLEARKRKAPVTSQAQGLGSPWAGAGPVGVCLQCLPVVETSFPFPWVLRHDFLIPSLL